MLNKVYPSYNRPKKPILTKSIYFKAYRVFVIIEKEVSQY